jgi:hypothetical protein
MVAPFSAGLCGAVRYEVSAEPADQVLRRTRDVR